MCEKLIAYLIILILSIGGIWLSQYLTSLEDTRYHLSKKEKIFNYIAVLISNLLVALNLNMNLGPILLLRCMMVALLFTSFIIDIKVMELPDTLTFVSLIPAICLFYYNIRLIDFGLSAAVIVLSCIIMIALFILGGLGFGDVKLIIPILLTVPGTYALSYWIIVLAAAVAESIFFYLFMKAKKISFGPCLIMSMIWIYIMNIF